MNDYCNVIGRNELELRTQLALNKALAARAPATPIRTSTQSRAATTLLHKRNDYCQLNDDQVELR